MELIEARRADLAQMAEAKAEAVANGREDFAALYQEGIDTLSRQLETFTEDKGEAHFLDGEGWLAAHLAFGSVGEIEMQEAVEAEIVATFERDQMTSPRIFGGIMLDLQAGGEGAFIDVRGYKITLDGDYITMTAKDGQSRSFPTADLITD